MSYPHNTRVHHCTHYSDLASLSLPTLLPDLLARGVEGRAVVVAEPVEHLEQQRHAVSEFVAGVDDAKNE